MDKFVLLSGPTENYVDCSSPHVKVTGKLVRKQIFTWGEFSHPNNPDFKINVDKDFYSKLKKNFDDRVCPIVQYPMVDASNRHVEDPERNLGEIVDLDSDEFGVNAYIDVRKHGDDVGRTILGASAKVSLDYLDTKTNKHVGPTLIHVAATNRPYLTDLDGYQTISASVDTVEDETVLLLSADSEGDIEESKPIKEAIVDKDELITALTELGVDVAAGQAALAERDGYLALSNTLGDGVEVSPTAIANAMLELSNSVTERETRIQEITAELQTLKLSGAEIEVDGLIEKGRILPSWRDDMIELSMTDRSRFETFLLPEEMAKVELSEVGFTSAESTQEEDPLTRAKETAKRLAAYTK